MGDRPRLGGLQVSSFQRAWGIEVDAVGHADAEAVDQLAAQPAGDCRPAQAGQLETENEG